MDADEGFIPTTKDHARSKYHHGRLPLFSNKTRGAHSCMVNVGHESRVCEPKGMWGPSRTSQAAHDAATAAPARGDHHHHHAPSAPAPARSKSGSVSSDEGGPGSSRSHSPRSPASSGDTPVRMHYEKPHHRMQSKKETLRASKEMSHHRDRNQRREDLATHGL